MVFIPLKHPPRRLLSGAAFLFAFSLLFLPLTAPAAESHLSSLASQPEWRLLDRYQKSITRAEFEDLLRRVYSLDGDFLRYTDLSDQSLVVWREPEKINKLWTLEFAESAATVQNRPGLFLPSGTSFLRGATPEQPLKGLRILLDPGHIGGDWSIMEQRHMKVGYMPPVLEAQLNLWSSRHLAAMLAQAGAEVLWTKNNEEPVTSLRPSDLETESLQLIHLRNPDSAKMKAADLLKTAEVRSQMLFYRVSEIQARAALVEKLKPDLTLCIHFNAAPDPNPGRPGVFDKNRLVLFVNGSYLPDELPFDDIKYDLLKKMLEGSHPAELAVADSIGRAMAKGWGIPPETYSNWPSANRVSEDPYVFSRNLIANRLFPGPVVFVEGPYMNDRESFVRIVAGDYEGTRLIERKARENIFKEFAAIMFQGVLDYYTAPPPPEPAPAPPSENPPSGVSPVP